MTEEEQRLRDLEIRFDALVLIVKSLVHAMRATTVSLDRDCDGDIVGVDIDLDWKTLSELEQYLTKPK